MKVSPRAKTAGFIRGVKSAALKKLPLGQRKTEHAKLLVKRNEFASILNTMHGARPMDTTSELMGLKFQTLNKCSAIRNSAVRSAKGNLVKSATTSITAIMAAASVAFFAIGATSALEPLSDPISSKAHSHTSKDIEAGHKQADDNTIDDFIEITPKELRNSAVFPWSRIVSMFSLNGTELLYNRGEEEIIDTLAATMSNAERSIKEDWEAALISDGTADGGRQMIGLGGAVPIVANSGTYGGINRTNVSNWRTTYYDVPNGDISGFTTWDVTTARPILARAALNRSRGAMYPSLAIADSLSYEPILASLVAHQRITSERSARLGFESIGVWTPAGLVDVVAAGGIGTVMPPNTVFMLDTDNISIYEFPGQSFVPFHPGDGIRPINQDAFAQGIVWSGQFVVENPLSQIRIKTA